MSRSLEANEGFFVTVSSYAIIAYRATTQVGSEIKKGLEQARCFPRTTDLRMGTYWSRQRSCIKLGSDSRLLCWTQ
jgi:hypothetical protein